MKYKIIQFTQI